MNKEEGGSFAAFFREAYLSPAFPDCPLYPSGPSVFPGVLQ